MKDKMPSGMMIAILEHAKKMGKGKEMSEDMAEMPEENEDEMEDEESNMGLAAASEEILTAIDNKDPDMLMTALKAFFDQCC